MIATPDKGDDMRPCRKTSWVSSGCRAPDRLRHKLPHMFCYLVINENLLNFSDSDEGAGIYSCVIGCECFYWVGRRIEG